MRKNQKAIDEDYEKTMDLLEKRSNNTGTEVDNVPTDEEIGVDVTEDTSVTPTSNSAEFKLMAEMDLFESFLKNKKDKELSRTAIENTIKTNKVSGYIAG